MSRRSRNNWRWVGYPAGVAVAGPPARPESTTFPRGEPRRVALYDAYTGARRDYASVEDYARAQAAVEG